MSIGPYKRRQRQQRSDGSAAAGPRRQGHSAIRHGGKERRAQRSVQGYRYGADRERFPCLQERSSLGVGMDARPALGDQS